MEHNFPAAPPSYEEAVQKQPAYNPHYPSKFDRSTAFFFTILCFSVAMTQPVYSAQVAPHPHPHPAPTAVVTTVLSVGPTPAGIVCPHCQKQIRTRVYTSVQKTAYVAALILCVFG